MPYNIIRSKRKTVAIHVTKDARVEVRAPLKASASKIDAFVRQKQAWIEKTIQNVSIRNEQAVSISKEQEFELRQEASKIIPTRVAFYAGMMGVSPSAVKISGAKTRWGSCSGKNSLNFSWRLMLGDIEIIDYVVVHELAHIKEHNHSNRFWAVVESVLPDYKQRQKKLRELQTFF